ncbi:zinc finger domain-containing protein [Streptomyces bangladeshensis]|uniref:DNA-binding phage zinc finger domain-containing protein n=1 Tax=Streptomyces bangladeshensis TaxID=295352 RepID=A0ABN3BSV8_9ACTN
MISYEEAGRLLGLAAARDQRTVGDADLLAWHADLNAATLTYRDAEAAITRFYAIEMASLQPDQRRRVTTPDVISIARKIRNERLENFIYEPPPGDHDPHYLKRLRGQLEATASGNTTPPTRPALTSSPTAPTRALLSSVGRRIPAEDDTPTERPPIQRPGPLGRQCPKCSAAIGRPCRTPGGKERPPHPARRTASTPRHPEEETA